jgi:hypothetical protein
MTVLVVGAVDRAVATHAGHAERDTYRPWTRRLCTALVVVQVVALALILVAWYWGSGELTVNEELSWLNLGLLGVGLSMAGNVLWLALARRSIVIARHHILPLPRRTSSEQAVSDDRPPVTGTGMTRYHRPGCLLVAGKATTSAPPATIEAQGLAPCPTCRP